ncbi:MAG: peptidoglycan-binding protein [Christensenellales bacterium]|jgi:uncharacterized protein YcbK (DUF882 family)
MAVLKFTRADTGKKLSMNFTVGDFWANSKLSEIKLDTVLADVLEKLYREFGKKPRLRNQYNGQKGDKYAPVASAGYRLSTDGGAKNSQHKYGRGVDIEIPGIPAVKLAQFAETLPEIGGIGLYYYAGQLDRQTHIHIDTRPSRARWGWKGNYSSHGRLPGWGGVPCVFKNGSQSAGVEIIQNWLRAQGYKDVVADGEYGPKTVAAVKDWQKANGLKADGMYGRDTNKKAQVFQW